MNVWEEGYVVPRLLSFIRRSGDVFDVVTSRDNDIASLIRCVPSPSHPIPFAMHTKTYLYVRTRNPSRLVYLETCLATSNSC